MRALTTIILLVLMALWLGAALIAMLTLTGF
jgi:hypothetical protein